MNRKSGVSIVVLLGFLSAVPAETLNLKGVVSTAGANPIAGAVVTLVSLHKSDTTDANGRYVFSNTSGISSVVPVVSERERIALTKGVLSIQLTAPKSLSIELFDMRGQQLDRVAEHRATAGEYRFNVGHHRFGMRMMLLRVNVGGQLSLLQYVPFGNSWTNRTVAGSSVNGGRFTKANAASTGIDTLTVTANGFTSVAVKIDSYSGEKNISLDSAEALDNFSFFVTSMKGLQELSGSDNGFGGDLRFGKTGAGAGLLGADSICQCLAEKSMPGSKVKKWSAFLSAAKGVDGNVVNAIDRIGDGPWYDRLGRLVANNKSELLNPRPINADEDIIDDLPNEFGVPNHRPDPNKAIVDNHMTITGSDSMGKLYQGGGSRYRDESSDGFTCDDWTSTTSTGTPRVGLSWPQSVAMRGGMKHWISAMTASGCEAGYDLDESTKAGLPGVYTIGNGGGYGGFYCFAHKP